MNLAEFEEAIKKHRRPVLGYVYACSGDLAVAEEIVQEACLTALKKKDTYQPEADFGSWLIAIARFIWLRECEKRGSHARAMKYLHEHADVLFTPELYAEDHWLDEKKALTGCLKKLPALDREIIDAHFLKCWKYQEIARHCEKSLTWVKVRMYRLRQSLRDCIRAAISREDGAAT